MASVLKADSWQDSNGNVIKTIINSYSHRWLDQTTTSSLTYIDVIGSSFIYTPIRSNSILMIQGEVSISPYNTTNNYTGQNYAIFVNGLEQGKQINNHEVYVSVGTAGPSDLYIGKMVKTALFTVTSLTPLTINIKTRVYNTANVLGRINQGNQWDSYIHVWEIAQ